MTDNPKWMKDAAEEIDIQYAAWEQDAANGRHYTFGQERLNAIEAIILKHCPAENEILGLLNKTKDDHAFIEDCKTIPGNVLQRMKRLAFALVFTEKQLKEQKRLCDYFAGRAKVAEQKLKEVKQ